MKYYLTLEKKKTPGHVGEQNADIEASAVELELALVTTTDDEPIPTARFEVIMMYEEIPEEWDRYFPEIKPGGRKGAVKRTGVYFGFSGKEDEKRAVIDFMEGLMDEGGKV
ncbi:MAG: hypothetical protein J0M02_15645 [Planctomycetes bacterium]|nr:hypothetical protein [Planctomycetota bacterium]